MGGPTSPIRSVRIKGSGVRNKVFFYYCFNSLLLMPDPNFSTEVFSEGVKVCGIFEMTEAVGKDKSIRLEASFEKIQELASEQCRHHSDRNEKTFAA